MNRFLVAFERPHTDLLPGPDPELHVEKAWNAWIDTLEARGLRLVTDLDPVAVTGDLEIYEAASR